MDVGTLIGAALFVLVAGVIIRFVLTDPPSRSRRDANVTAASVGSTVAGVDAGGDAPGHGHGHAGHGHGGGDGHGGHDGGFGGHGGFDGGGHGGGGDGGGSIAT